MPGSKSSNAQTSSYRSKRLPLQRFFKNCRLCRLFPFSATKAARLTLYLSRLLLISKSVCFQLRVQTCEQGYMHRRRECSFALCFDECSEAHLIWYSVKHQIICCEVLLCGSTTTLLMSDSDLYEKRKHKSKGSERRTTEREIRKTTDIAQNKS